MKSDLSGTQIVGGYAFEKIAFQLCVFDLFLDIQVDCVVVGSELIALEKLNCCLVQLNHDDLVQET